MINNTLVILIFSCICIIYYYYFQLISQAKGEGTIDEIKLDVHAISELQSKGVPATNDLPKYSYRSLNDSPDSKYGMVLSNIFFYYCYLFTSSVLSETLLSKCTASHTHAGKIFKLHYN